jgi:glucokinase
MNRKLLVADIGGTRARFDVVECRDGNFSVSKVFEYKSEDYKDFLELLDTVMAEHEGELKEIEEGCFAVAGVGDGELYKITNLPWVIERESIKKKAGLKKFFLLNDLQASAYGLNVTGGKGFLTLIEGEEGRGNAGILSPGTGLGEAILTVDQEAIATESGHTDFAPVDDVQFELALYLKNKFGRVSLENVLSGIGLGNIYSFLTKSDVKKRGRDVTDGAKKGDPVSMMAVEIFARVLIQEAGNLALRCLARRGVFIGGGIAPNILPFLQKKETLDLFFHKEPLNSVMKTIPLKVILDDQLAVFGCAWYSQHV